MRLPRSSRRGTSLTEVIIVTAMIAIMATAMSSLIIAVQRSFSSYEASSGIQTSAQAALNSIMTNLIQSKRLFDATADPAWLTAAETAGAPTGGPAIMPGSRLPTIQVGGSFSPSSSTFSPSSVGNQLYFLSVDPPQSMTIANQSGTMLPALIDAYHFNLYYLTYGSGAGFAGSPPIALQQWQSVSFADYQEMANLADGVMTINAAAAMWAAGYRYAIDTTTAAAINGFYSINAAGLMSVIGPVVPLKSTKPMIKILTGVSGYSYHYSVSPNTTAAFTHLYPVPVFATAAAPFPAGFETMIVGSNSARQVYARLVLVAGGAFKGYKATGPNVSATVRDQY